VGGLAQVYINGEFVGGADIVEQLHTSGELKQLLSQQKVSAS
jgi:glutaredoxin-related protein